MKDENKTKKQLISELVELRKRITKLEKSETEQKQVVEALNESEKKYQRLADNSLVGIYKTNLKGDILYINEALLRMLEFDSSEEMVSINALTTYKNPDDRNVIIETLMKTGRISNFETGLLTKTGKSKNVILSTTLDKDAISGMMQDITERKKAEEAMQRAVWQWQSTFNAIGDSICLIDNEGKILQHNKAMEHLLGKPSQEIIGRPCWELMHGRSEPIEDCPIVRMRESLRRETLVIQQGDRWFEVTTDPLLGEGGNLMGGVHVIVDITERKRAEEELNAERFKLREFFDNLPTLAYNISLDGKIMDCNPEAIKTLGYKSKEDLIGKALVDTIYAPSSRQKASQLFKRWNKEGKLKNEEMQIITNQGKIRDVLLNVDTIYDMNGNPLYSISTQLDITERKRAEEALQKSEARYRDLYDNAPDMYHTLDENGVILDCNETEARMLGYKKEEITGRPVTDFFTEESRRLYEIDFPQLKEKKALFNLGRQFVRKDGTTFPAILNVFSVYNKDGEFIGTKTISRDITVLKQSEEALQKGKEFSDSLITLMQDGFSVLDSHGVNINVNPTLCQMTGFSREELIGTGPPHPYWPPEAYEEIDSAFQKTLRGELGSFELTFMRKNGERFPAIVSPSHIKDKQGNIINYFATIKDISERKQAEEALKQSELKYKNIIRTTQDGFWYVDTDGRFLDVNDAACKMLGYERGELIKMKISDIEAIEDEADVIRHIAKMRDAGGDRFETKHKRKDGTIVEVEATTSFIKDADNERIFVFVRDITARKLAEEEIRKFKTISDRAGYGVAMSDLEGNLLYVNKSFTKMHGYTAEELIGRNLSVFHNEEQMENVDRLKKKLQEMGSYITEEVWHMRKDGTFFPTLMHGTLVRDAEGKPLFMAATAIDITKQKQAEDALEEREERYRLLFTNVSDAVFVHEVAPDASDPSRFRFIEVNDNACQYLGYSREELLQMSVLQIDAPETLENIPALMSLLHKWQDQAFCHAEFISASNKINIL